MADAIHFFDITIAFLVFNCIAGVLAVVFNITEIYLIRKSWKTVTQFEMVLMNLAVADTMTGFISLSLSGVCAYMNAINAKDNVLLTCLSLPMILPVTSSTLFVVSIGYERYRAIKSPLKHRYKTASRKPTIRCIVVNWVLTSTITTVVVVLGVLDMKGIINAKYFAYKLTLAVGIFLTVGMSLIVLLYANVMSSVLRRITWLSKYDPNVPKNTLLAAIHKELSTIILCTLVIVTYLACNIPITVSMFYTRIRAVDVVFVTLNSVTNPLIYFFKGYTERFCAKQPIKLVGVPGTEVKGQSKNQVSHKEFNGTAVTSEVKTEEAFAMLNV